MGQIKDRQIRTPHIVSTWSAGRLGLTVVFVVLALGGWAYLAFDLTRERLRGPSAEEPAVVMAGLHNELAQESAALESRLGALDQAREQSADAVAQAQEQLLQLQAENAKLRARLAFLNQLFGANDGPLAISDLELSSAGEEGARYWFKVSRTNGEDSLITGEALIQVRGFQQGEERYLSLAELGGEGNEGHRLGFRHFQEIDGAIQLPPDFKPEQLIVIVAPEDESIAGARRQFDWSLPGASEQEQLESN